MNEHKLKSDNTSKKVNPRRKKDSLPVKKNHDKLNIGDLGMQSELLEINKKLQNEIVDRIKVEKEIKKARDDYLAITNLTGDIIIHSNKNDEWTFLNDVACEFWGKPREKLLGISFGEYIHPDDIEKTVSSINKMIKKKKLWKGFINRQKTPDGWRTVEWNASPIIDESGNYSGIQATGRDITERKETEEILKKREAFNFALFQYNPAETIIVDLEGKILRSNLAKKISGDRIPNIGDVMYKDYASRHKIDMHEKLMKSIRTKKVMNFPEMQYLDRYLSITISPFSEGALIISENITERKKTEMTLQRSEQKFRSLFESATEFIHILDKDGIILQSNPVAILKSGYPENELVGHRLSDFFSPTTKKKFENEFNYLKEKQNHRAELDFVFKDGTVMICDCSAIVVYGESEESEYIVVYQRDITKRKQSEEELKQAHGELELRVKARTSELKKVNDNLTKEINERIKAEAEVRQQIKRIEYLAKTSTEYVKLSLNEDIYKIIGEKLIEITDNAIVSINIFEDAPDKMVTKFISGIEKNIEKIIKMLGKHPLGMVYSVTEEQKKPMKESNIQKIEGGFYELTFGNIPKVVCKKFESIFNIDEIYGIGLTQKEIVYGAITIITFKNTRPLDFELIEAVCNESSIALQRWIANDAVQRSEEKYHSLTESINEVIYSLDQNGIVTFVGPQIERYGYIKEEVIGHSFLDFVFPEDSDMVFENFQTTINEGKEFPTRFRLVDKKGGIRNIEDNGKVQLDESGNVIGLIGILHDITNSKIIADKLERKNMELDSLINNIPDMAWLKDSESRFMSVNRAFCRMVGFSQEALEGHTCEICFGKENAASFRKDDLEVMNSRKQRTIEEKILDTENNEIFLETIKAPIITDSGDVVGTVGISRDITERKKIENTLKISEEKLLEQKTALEQKTFALREIIEQVEIEKKLIKDNIMVNVEKIVMPILERMKLNSESEEYIDLLQNIIENLTSSYGSEITKVNYKLTSREIEICNMIKKGLMNKEISSLLNISTRTIENHRKNIRKKLKIQNKNINLTTFLKQLQ
ncbi:PAS domain S-box protein [Candidatus Latescibacterota bacterium]